MKHAVGSPGTSISSFRKNDSFEQLKTTRAKRCCFIFSSCKSGAFCACFLLISSAVLVMMVFSHAASQELENLIPSLRRPV